MGLREIEWTHKSRSKANVTLTSSALGLQPDHTFIGFDSCLLSNQTSFPTWNLEPSNEQPLSGNHSYHRQRKVVFCSKWCWLAWIYSRASFTCINTGTNCFLPSHSLGSLGPGVCLRIARWVVWTLFVSYYTGVLSMLCFTEACRLLPTACF